MSYFSEDAHIFKPLLFKSLKHYTTYWDKIVANCRASNDTFAREITSDLDNLISYDNNELRRGEDEGNIGWYGSPVPKNWQDAMNRNVYENMGLYNSKYDELSPFFSMLEKISLGILPKEVIKPNDRQLGMFSLERALMSIDEILGLWSDKHAKYFYMGDGDVVLDKNGNEKKIKVKREVYGEIKEVEATLFKLRLDGSEAYLTQLEEGYEWDAKLKERKNGSPQWGSKNKSSFLYKEKHPRPNRNIRLFCTIGANCGHRELYWSGVATVLLANFLMFKGYAVRITAVVCQANGWGTYNKDGKQIDGYRTCLFDVKSYEETLDSPKILYCLADASFFRVRVFQYWTAHQWYYKDSRNTGLGRVPTSEEVEKVLLKAMKNKEIESEAETLYYFIGGDDVTSLERCKNLLTRIICMAEHTNKKALSDLGKEFPPPPPQERNDIDCTRYIQNII
jgi:hypothetical protein